MYAAQVLEHGIANLALPAVAAVWARAASRGPLVSCRSGQPEAQDGYPRSRKTEVTGMAPGHNRPRGQWPSAAVTSVIIMKNSDIEKLSFKVRLIKVTDNRGDQDGYEQRARGLDGHRDELWRGGSPPIPHQLRHPAETDAGGPSPRSFRAAASGST